METFTNFKKQLFTQSESVTRTTSASTRSMGAIFVLRTCLLFCLLMGINVEAWGGKVKLTVISSPSSGGYVYANTSNTNNIGTATSDDATSSYKVGGDVTMYRFANAASGYIFKGWADSDGGTPTSTSTSISLGANIGTSTKNYTYYAIFVKIYSVKFHGNGSTSGSMSNLGFEYGTAQNLTLNAFSRTNYNFKGWNTAANGSGTSYNDGQNVNNLTSTAGGIVTLYAQWLANYTIAFDANGGSGSIASMSMVQGTAKNLSANTFTRSGYTFVGWNTVADGSGITYSNAQNVNNLTTEGGSTITLYAQWKANYSVVFHANGGNGSMTDQAFVEGTAQNLKSNAFTRTGYTFAGWATSADGNVVYTNEENVNNLSTTGNAEIPLFAKWTAHTYLVAFNGNGNTSGSMSNQAFTYDEDAKALTANAFAKSYTVTFEANGGTCETASLNAVSPFLGWATSANGEKVYDDEQSVRNLTAENNGTVNLYAKWGVGSIVLPTATGETNLDHLEGWFNGEEKVGDAGSAYTPTANIALTARWTREQLTPSFGGENTALKVGAEQTSAFSFNNTEGPVAHIDVTAIDAINDGSGKVIEYDANTNTIIARNAGTATIYFTQAETQAVKAATSATWTYTITKNDPAFSGSAYNDLKVDDVQTADYTYSNTSALLPSASAEDDFYFTVDDIVFANAEKNKGTNLVTYNPSTKEITANNAGTGKITLHQKETYKYNAGSASFAVAISKYTPSFSGSAYNDLKVGDVQIADYVYSNTSAAKPSASVEDDFYYSVVDVVFTNAEKNNGNELVSYDPVGNGITALNAGSGKITLYQKENNKYNAGSAAFEVSASKYTPSFTWNAAATYNHNTKAGNIFSTNNNECPYTITSSDATIAYVEDNMLYVLTKSGSPTFTVTQEENYKWNSKTQNYSIGTQFPSNHLPFTISSENNSTYFKEKSSNASWDNNGYKIGDGGWTDVEGYVTIYFTGVPDYVSFDKHLDNSLGQLPVGSKAIVYESADNSNWTELWKNEDRTADVSGNKALKPETRYLKFYYKGSIYCHYNNIKITEKKQFDVTATSFDFSTNYIKSNCESKTFSINYANAGHKVTLTVDDPAFSVSPTEITTIGGEKVGTYTPITVSYSTANEHTATNATLTVQDELGNKKTITLKGNTIKYPQSLSWTTVPDEITYDDEATVLVTNSVDSMQPYVYYVSSDSTVIDVNGAQLIAKKVGKATITAKSDETEMYYAATPISKEIEVKKIVPVLTAPSAENEITYGAPLSTLNLVGGSAARLNETDIPGTYAWQDGSQVLSAGTHNDVVVLFTPEDQTIYDTITATISVTVNKKELTVTADNKAVTYGDAAPEYSVAYDGFIEGESAANLSGELAFDCVYAAGSAVNTYDIIPKGLTSDNYAITFTKGTLTVNKATLTITAENKEVTYGAEAPAFTVNYAGFVAEDDATALGGELAFACEYEAGNGVGKYDITASGLTSDNYTIDFVGGKLTVNKAALTITAENKEVTYGADVPAFTVAYDGWKGTDEPSVLTGELAFACEYEAGKGVGAYTITPSGLEAANYEIAFTAGTLTVNKAASSAVPPAAIENLVYNGEAQTLIAAGSAEGGELQYSLDGENWSAELPQAVNAGAYAIYYKVVADDNHNDYTAEAPVAAEIAKANASVMAPAAIENLVYNGEAQILITAGSAQGGELQYSLDGENWSTELPTAIEGGKYTVSYRVAGDANHDSIDVASLYVTIDYTIAYELAGGIVETENPTHYNAETETFTLNNPTKEHYTFAGWTGSNGEEPQTEVTIEQGATGNRTYTANWTINKYQITWLNADESLIETTEVEYGAMPEHADAEKAATAQYTYTFKGWTPALAEVTGVATYKAEFDSTVNVYNVIFQNADGTELQKTQLAYGETPVYEGEEPTKAADAQYTYTFNGWDNEIVAVTGNATYTATFSQTVNKYQITFMNGETVLQSSEVEYGATPVYTGETPVKAADAQNTYAFAGWDAEIVAVTGNATYTATFSSTVNKYTITWLNADESLIETTEVEYGAMPAHADAEKAATAQYTYTFKGWTPALAEVTGEATYTAEYDSTVNVYTVIFKNGEEVLQSSQLAYGETPVYEGATPTKAADAQYTYTFKGWDNEIVAVIGEAIYTAEYDSTLNKYLITFMNGETVLQSSEVEYGAMPEYTGEAPTKDATAQYTYTFKGWTPALAEVTGEATYTAEFDSLAVVPEKQFQMIVWDQELSTIEVGDATLQLNAEAGSWLDVYYTSSDSTIAYVNEQNYVVALKAGEVTITAHQNGNETYLAAEPVSKTLTVTNNGQQGGGHDATAVDDAQGNSVQCTKVLRGNQVLIIRDGKTYNLRGQRVD